MATQEPTFEEVLDLCETTPPTPEAALDRSHRAGPRCAVTAGRSEAAATALTLWVMARPRHNYKCKRY